MKDLEKKVYQMFILGLEQDFLPDNSNLKKALNKGLGGTILFTKNIKSIEQTKKLNKDIKINSLIPPFLSVDEEGGRVERTENIFGGKKFLSQKFAAEKGETFLIEQTIQISKLLKSMHFNLNYAPCLDVNSNPDNPIIGERAFSDKTADVIKYGKIVNNTYLENGIITCAKHFPGHGDADKDSHNELPFINLSFDEIENTHIKPFSQINTPLIMVAHLHCKAFDIEKTPSSLSKNVINYIRNNMKYKGIIISDDMVMGAIKNENETGTDIAIKSIKAGVNILLYRNSLDNTINIIENIIEISKNDKPLSQKIDDSFNRIIEFKNKQFIS